MISIQVNTVSYVRDFLQNFNRLRLEGRHCDFVIKCGDDIHDVHKCVLTGSEYFRGMLEKDTPENKEGVAEFNNIYPIAVRQAVDFMYTGKVSIERRNIESLIRVACLWDLEVLREKIGKVIEDGLDGTESFYSAKKFADTYGCKGLELACKQYAFKKFKAIIEHEEFAGLEEDYVYALIRSPCTNAEEVVKYKAFVKWINFDVVSREKHFYNMFLALNISDLPVVFRRHLRENQPIIRESDDCLRALLDSLFGDVMQKDNNTGSCANAILASAKNAIYAYDMKMQLWHELCDIGDAFQSYSIVTLDKYIYALRKDRMVFRRELLNVTGNWIEMASMRQDHGSYPSVVVLGDSIYAVGNADLGDCNTEKYNVTTNTWTQVVSGNRQFKTRRQFAACSSSDSIFFIGGCNIVTEKVQRKIRSQTPHIPQMVKVMKSHVECDRFIGGSTLRSIAPMIQARRCPGVAHANGRIYVVGGDDSNQAGEIYDIRTNRWTVITKLPTALSPVGAVFVMDSLFVVDSSRIFEYNAHRRSWEKKENKNGVSIIPKAGCIPIVF